jgi:uncharacterized membrane protein YccC
VRNSILDWLKGDIAARRGKLADDAVTKLASPVRRLTNRLPQPQVLRHATRMTVAAVLAFAAAWAFALPQGYWAVISAVVVMQSSLGGTLGASLDRLMATVAGAMAGAACVFLRGRTPLPEVLVLTLAVGPTALLAALRPSFRLAPITAVIVLVGASPGAGLLTAFHRVVEITLGCVIGALTAHLVMPDRARVAIETGAAGVLDGLGKVVAAHLTGADAAHIDALNELVRRHLTAVATAAAEDARERALSLRTGPPAAPLLRTLRRVRSDVAFLGRAMAFEPRQVEVTTSEALSRHFAEAAAFLCGIGSAPALATLDGVIGTVPPDSVLGFSLVTLRRDLADLDERLAEQVTGDAV